MIKIILVPLDGSERSAEVLDTALVVANRFNAHIKAVHVREHSGEPFMFSEVPASYRKEFVEMNGKAVDAVVDTVNSSSMHFARAAGSRKCVNRPHRHRWRRRWTCSRAMPRPFCRANRGWST